jgi:hypothetical protein
MEQGIVERHYLKCPHCFDRANLEDHRCSNCGALAVSILWTEPIIRQTPELVMVTRVN